MRCCVPAILAAALLLGGCREGDGPADPSAIDARIYLKSDPNGAAIEIDSRSTGRVTPDTIALRRGEHVIVLELDSAGFEYAYGAILDIERTDTVAELTLPVALQCVVTACFTRVQRSHEAGGVSFAASAVGTLLRGDGAMRGLAWPAGTSDRYAASGMPVLAGVADGVQVALGVYDQFMLAGRPAPAVVRNGDAFRLTQQAWIVPPFSSLVRPTTVRGILVEEEISAHEAVDGVLVVRLTFRNVSDDTLVHAFAPHMPRSAVTYTNTWIGFAMDADIGTAGDDWLSYDVDRNMVFAYDASFAEAEFSAPRAVAPGLIGLRVLQAPPGTTVLLNSWPLDGDWSAGTASESVGYGMLTGSAIYSPQHAHPQIGYLPPDSRDMRMSVTAGPLTLAPGDAAEILIAIAVAPPAAGTFVSGTQLAPGDPLDTTRALYAVAAELRARMTAAESLPVN